MLGYKSLRSLLMATVVMVAIPSAAEAQAYSSRLWSFDFYGGVAIPTSDLGDISKTGASFGVGADYYLSNRIGLRLEGTLDLLGGKDDDLLIPTPLVSGESGAPSLRLYHLNGGVEVDLVDRTDRKVNFTLFVLGGMVIVNSDKFVSPPSPSAPNGTVSADWQDAYPELRAGFRLGFQLGDCVPARARVCGDFFINGGAHLMFGNEDDTEFIAALYNTSAFSSFYSFPIQIGFRINVL
jgi:hypothetical protein